MKKLILLIFLTSIFQTSQAQCNATLVGTNTSVISANTTINSAGSWKDSILICSGATLTYDYMFEYRQFYVRSGATLVLNKIQICEVYLEQGATLQIDTIGTLAPMVSNIYFDSSNVTLIDTNQLQSGINWNHCAGNTFNYSVFTPAQPCTPLSVNNNLSSVLDVTFTNPVYDNMHFHSLVSSQIAGIKIMDLSGKVVQKIGSPARNLDVSSLPNGMYFIQFIDKEGRALTKKMVKR
jgi:hypothetical protein